MVVFQAASQEKQKRIAFLTTRINPNLPISLFEISSLPHEDTPRPAFFRAANRFYRTFIAK